MKIIDIIPEYFIESSILIPNPGNANVPGTPIVPKYKKLDISVGPNLGITNRLPKPTSGLDLSNVLDKPKDTPLTKDSALDILKHASKVIRGKKPIYTTKGGTEINVDGVGSDKGIKIKKTF
jgi:hypothetical protein